MFALRHRSRCSFLATMGFFSRKETYDSYTPSVSSSRTSRNRSLHRKTSKEAIQSYRGSISNSSVHTTSTAATRKDLFDRSGQGSGGDSSNSDPKSLHAFEKSTFGFRNQSQSSVGTIRKPKFNSSSAANFAPKQKVRSLNEDEESPLPSTRSSVYRLPTPPDPSPSSSRIHDVPRPTPLDGSITKPYGDSQPFATTEIPTADKPPVRHHSSLPPPTDRMGVTYRSPIVPSTKEATSLSRTDTNLKSSRQSIQAYQELLSNVNVHAAAAANYKDPFVPSGQALPTPSSHNASKPSRQSIQEYQELLSNANIHAAAAASSATFSPSVPVKSFYPSPADRMGTIPRSRSGTVTAKGKKSMLGFMTDFLNSNKRPEISTPYDQVHLTHVGFNSSTGEFTGLPKEWQQLLQDSGISKSDQEKNPLAVMEIVKFYQEGGGDVWDKMGHAPAPGSSRSPPIPGTTQLAAYPGLSKSVDDSFVPTVSVSIILHGHLLTVQSGRRCRLRKRPTLPVACTVHLRLTHQHHTALRRLHRSLRSLTSTGPTLNDQYPNRLAVTHSPAQTLLRTGALRGHRRQSRRPPENHPTLRPRILHLSHKLLWPRTARRQSVGLLSLLQHHSSRVRLLQAWQRPRVRLQGDVRRKRKTKQTTLILSSGCSRFAQMQILRDYIAIS